MQPLIDADVLVYEIGFAAETGWKAVKGDNWKEGEVPPFDYVAELLDNRIADICGKVSATQPPILFLTGAGNFRFQIAKRVPYKDRPSHKPWHYKNIKAYMQGKYDVRIAEGIEADDAICIAQTSTIKWGEPEWESTIICTRDKDLRQCPGWYYGWELGHQPEFGPLLVDEFGKIELKKDGKEIKGYGGIFFYAQLLIGDKVDSIPGIPGIGPKKAWDIIGDVQTLDEAEEAVVGAYKAVYGDDWYEEFMEQAHLLYMIRELDEDGHPVMFRLRGKY